MAARVPESSLPLWARRPTLVAIVLGMAVLKLLIAGSTELQFDEAYYTLWSLQLSPGYLDHPPAVAWLIALGRVVAGNNEIGVRLPAILSDVMVAAAVHRIGILLFDARVAALAVIWHTVSIAAALGLIMTPDAPSILFWTLTLWAVAEFARSGQGWWWLAAGAFAGLGLDSKLTNLMLAPGLLLFVLASAERRRWFRRWELWAAPVVAVLAFAPVLAWNAANGWLTFWFQGRRTLGAEATLNGFGSHILEMVAGQMLAVGPPLACFVAVALVLAARRRSGPEETGLSLGLLTSLAPLLYFVVHATHSRVELNWLLPIWPALTLCGTWAALCLQPPGWRGGLSRLGGKVQVLYGIIVIALVFTQAVYHPFAGVSFDRTRDLHGWREATARVHQLARENGARWIVNVGDYGLTGQFAAYGHFQGSPLPVHQLDDRLRYLFRGPLDPEALGWPALYISGVSNPASPIPPDHHFGRSELLSVIERRRGDEILQYFGVYLVSAPTAAFAAFSGR